MLALQHNKSDARNLYLCQPTPCVPQADASIVWRPTHVNSLTSQCTAIAAGGDHSACITEHGTALHWGRPLDQCSEQGAPQTLLGPPYAAAKVALGWHHAVLLDTQGGVWTVGSNRHGQLGPCDEGGLLPKALFGSRHIVDVACGSEHCLAVDEEGCVWAWGWGEHGMLGDGQSQDQRSPVAAHAPVHKGMRVAAGAGFSLAWGHSAAA